MSTEAVKNGQHIYHVIVANGLSISKSFAYRYIEKGYFSIKKIDLLRAVKFKPRAAKREEHVPSKMRKGRQYQDFLDFMKNNTNPICQEMDTVIGTPGGKIIMTFKFINQDFMFGLLLENRSSLEAARKITELKNRLTEIDESFGEIFPVLLTDNSGEFSNVFAFENDLNGES